MWVPGAVMSGFIRPSSVGPPEEKERDVQCVVGVGIFDVATVSSVLS
jgi:hypothetical protein